MAQSAREAAGINSAVLGEIQKAVFLLNMHGNQEATGGRIAVCRGAVEDIQTLAADLFDATVPPLPFPADTVES